MAEKEILLSNEEFIKSVSSLSDNLAGKYLLPSLREAQEINLRSILGDCLLDKVKRLVKDKSIEAEENKAYKDLVGNINLQYFLAYTTIVEVTNKISYKLGNFGVAKSNDENLQVASQDEIAKMQEYYQSKADFHCMTLQNFILEHCSDYPELSKACCDRIASNLYSSASCGLFLGGARGKILPR